ncbi:MAG: Arc family DNA-binding protein [Comamonas sp.]
MSREDPQMKIRLPADLKDRIEESAKALGRSMNSEIVGRLEGSFDVAKSEEEQAFQDAFDLASLRIENERLKEQMHADRMQFFQSRQSADLVGKTLEQLPSELVSQYGLHLYRSELEKVEAALEKCYAQAGDAHEHHQQLLKDDAAPGPVSRSSEKLGRLGKRINELNEQVHLLRQAISGIHTYRKVHGLKELRNVKSVTVGLQVT